MAIIKSVSAETSTGVEFIVNRHTESPGSDRDITLSAYLPGSSSSLIFHLTADDCRKLMDAILEALV